MSQCRSLEEAGDEPEFFPLQDLVGAASWERCELGRISQNMGLHGD